MRGIIIVLFFFLSIVSNDTFAQKASRIKYKAEKLVNVRQGNSRFKKLIDKVVFKQNNTIVYCDSAYYFTKENIMEAYGKVRIKDGDSVTITSRKLIYKGNEGMALLRENVVYKRGKKYLYTDFLDYDMINEIAEFKNNGKLVDTQNTLTSSYGMFHSRINYAYFYKDVLLVAPDYNLTSDTLEYSTTTKVAITKGPTFIENKDGTTVDAEGGTFKTVVDQTVFKDGVIETRDYILIGDDIFIDDLKRYYTAKGNVVMTSKKDDVIIFGDEGVYDRKEGISKVYGDPLMKRAMKFDTLFLSADTLVSIEDADKDKERILAFNKVLIFKENLQGKCDSLSYFLADSTMHMYNDPLLWNKNSQMEADSINLVFKNEVIDEMIMRRQSFLTSIDTMGQYNQIKGRNMLGHFDELGEIEKIDVKGNGESHYFVLEGDSLFVGMNKIYCSNMTLRFEKNVIQNITFYKNPEAKFIPPHELKKGEVLLEGFDWRGDERPELHDVAKYYTPPEVEQQVLQLPAIPDGEVLNNMIDEVKTKVDIGEVKKAIQPFIKK